MKRILVAIIVVSLLSVLACNKSKETKEATTKEVAKKEVAQKQPKTTQKPKLLKKYLPAKGCKDMYDKYSSNIPQLKNGKPFDKTIALIMGNTREDAFYTPRFKLGKDATCAVEELNEASWATDQWTIRFSYLKTNKPNTPCEPFAVAWNAEGSLDTLFVLARMALRNGCKPFDVNLIGASPKSAYPPVFVEAKLCPVEFENENCGKGNDIALFTLDIANLDWQPAGETNGKMIKLPIERKTATDLINKWVAEMVKPYKGNKFAVLADKNAKVFALWSVVDAIYSVKPKATVYIRISGTD